MLYIECSRGYIPIHALRSITVSVINASMRKVGSTMLNSGLEEHVLSGVLILKVWSHHSATMKIRAIKVCTQTFGGISMKFYTSKNFIWYQ